MSPTGVTTDELRVKAIDAVSSSNHESTLVPNLNSKEPYVLYWPLTKKR